MTSRPGARQGFHDTAAAAEAPPRGRARPLPGGSPVDDAGSEPISRILSSLDKLGARIRALSAEPAQPTVASPADPTAAGMIDLQRAVAEIARKRDAIDRDFEPVRRPAAAASRPDTAPLPRADFMPPPRVSEPKPEKAAARPSPRPPKASVSADLFAEIREDLTALKSAVAANASLDAVRALERNYDALVNRMDEIRGAIESPRMLSDLVQRMAEVRRLLAGAPTEAQVRTIEQRLDVLSDRIEASAEGRAGSAGLDMQFEALAKAIGQLDITPLVDAVETRLRSVDNQVAELMSRVPGLEAVERIMDTVVRQSEAIEVLSHRTEGLPKLAEEMSALRGDVRSGTASSQKAVEALVSRLDDLAERIERAQTDTDRPFLEQIAEQVGEVVRRLDKLDEDPDAATIQALEERFERLARGLEGRLEQLDRNVGAGLGDALARIEQHLSSDIADDRFTRLEERLAEVSALIAEGSGASLDIARIEEEFETLKGHILALQPQSLEGLEAGIRALANRIDAIGRPVSDAAALDQIDSRVADLLQRLDARGVDGALIAEQMDRIEKAVLASADAQDLAATAARVATETLTERDGREALSAIAQLQRGLVALHSDLQAVVQRDRDMLLAMNRSIEQLVALAEKQPLPVAAAAPAEAAPAPTAARPETKGEGWSAIQRSLVDVLKRSGEERREKMATATPPPAAEAAAVVPEVKTPAAGAKAAAPEVKVAAAEIKTAAPASAPEPKLDSADEPLDLVADEPLEPGSGKPVFGSRSRSADVDVDAPRAEGRRPTGEPTKEDFIAAARRAAQAAALEMDQAKKPKPSKKAALRAERPTVSGDEPSTADERAPGFLSVFGRHKIKLMSAAAIVVLAVGATFAVKTLVLDPMVGEPVATLAPEPASAPAPVAEAAPEPAPAPEPVETVEAVEAEPPQSTASLPEPPPASMPDAKAITAEPLGPATTFQAEPAPAPAAPVASGPVELPPETVGPMALRQAAADGNSAAQFEVAARLTEGRGTPQDLKTAATWYERAAANGLPAAQYRIGSLYEKGQGVPRDAKIAKGWYEKAAAAGNAKAMHNLAVLNTDGSLGVPDYQEAAKWFAAAADLGVRDSQYNLGILYARGLGVDRDLAASYKWFAIAAQGGDQDAAKKRDDVAQSLDKDMLARARLAVETWRAQEPEPAANEVDTGNPDWMAQPDKTASVGPVDPVAQVQALLARRGYNPGPADGHMGSKTRDAITAFQAAAGLPPTGEVDDRLIQALAGPVL